MPVKPTFKVHVKEFNEYLGKLNKQIHGVSFRKIIKGEAGSILARAAALTKAAKPKDIEKRYKIVDRQRKHLPEHMRTRKRNTSGQWTKMPGQTKGSRVPQDPKLVDAIVVGGKRYFTKNYYPNHIYKKVKDALKNKMEEKKKRRMSGRATWYLIAKKAKVPTRSFETLAGIQGAIRAQSGSYASNKTENGKEEKKMFSYGIRVDNNANCALNKNARGSFAIRSAMAGRAGYMKKNMRKKVFDTFKAEAEAYPNIFAKD